MLNAYEQEHRIYKINDRILGHLDSKMPTKALFIRTAVESSRRHPELPEKRLLKQTLTRKIRSVIEEPGIFLSLASIEAGQTLVDIYPKPVMNVINRINGVRDNIAAGFSKPKRWIKESLPTSPALVRTIAEVPLSIAEGLISAPLAAIQIPLELPYGTAKFLTEAPVQLQASVDLRNFAIDKSADLISEDNTVKDEYLSLARSYGLNRDSVLVHNPRLVGNLRKSLALWFPYGEGIKWTGLPLQAALSALFLFEPTVHNFVGNNIVGVDAVAIGSAGGLAIWRMQQEVNAINKHGYNPDFLMTAPALLTSRVEGGEYKMDTTKWVIIANTLDWAKSLAIYHAPVAFNEYLLAASFVCDTYDMLYHGLANKHLDKFESLVAFTRQHLALN